MNFRDYNDFEIISLIQEGQEEALALMIEKYHLLIAKKINKFNLRDEFDDYYQEALLVLYRSIQKFKPSFNKTFTKFFELNLDRYFISSVRKRTRQYQFMKQEIVSLYEETVVYPVEYEYSSDAFEMLFNQMSSFEQSVFQYRFLDKETIPLIATKLQTDVKSVYNAIDRIRMKVKMHLE